MCFIYRDTVVGPADSTCEAFMPGGMMISSAHLSYEPIPAPSAAKRRSSDALEHQPVKKARTLGETSRDTEKIVAPPASLSEVDSLRAEISKQAMEISRLQCQEMEKKKLESELKESIEERTEWQLKYYTQEEDLEILKAEIESRKGGKNASTNAASKKFEDAIKQKYDTKLQKQKETYEDKIETLEGKHKQDRKKKHQLYQEKINELREKQAHALEAAKGDCEAKVEEAKAKSDEKIAVAKERELATKAELADGKKALAESRKKMKADQQEAIRKFKPGHSDEAKAQKKTISDQAAQLEKARSAFSDMKQHVEKCEKSVHDKIAEKKTLEGIIMQQSETEDELRADHNGKERYITTMLRSHSDEKTALQDRVRYEGERWQLQYNCAQNTKSQLVDQQRSNFELRGMTNSRDKRIQTLTAELGMARRELEEASRELLGAKHELHDARGKVDVLELAEGTVEKDRTDAMETGEHSAETKAANQEIEQASTTAVEESIKVTRQGEMSTEGLGATEGYETAGIAVEGRRQAQEPSDVEATRMKDDFGGRDTIAGDGLAGKESGGTMVANGETEVDGGMAGVSNAMVTAV